MALFFISVKISDLKLHKAIKFLTGEIMPHKKTGAVPVFLCFA
jgi:hypothetical protein